MERHFTGPQRPTVKEHARGPTAGHQRRDRRKGPCAWVENSGTGEDCQELSPSMEITPGMGSSKITCGQ